MKSTIPIFIAICFFQLSNAQEMPYKGPDAFLIGNRQVPQVLLMGTWHFAYPGLDEHKTKEEDKINIFTPKRQEELQDLLDYVAQFQPTKIIVESGANTGYLMNRYRRWKRAKKTFLPMSTIRSAYGLQISWGWMQFMAVMPGGYWEIFRKT